MDTTTSSSHSQIIHYGYLIFVSYFVQPFTVSTNEPRNSSVRDITMFLGGLIRRMPAGLLPSFAKKDAMISDLMRTVLDMENAHEIEIGGLRRSSPHLVGRARQRALNRQQEFRLTMRRENALQTTFALVSNNFEQWRRHVSAVHQEVEDANEETIGLAANLAKVVWELEAKEQELQEVRARLDHAMCEVIGAKLELCELDEELAESRAESSEHPMDWADAVWELETTKVDLVDTTTLLNERTNTLCEKTRELVNCRNKLQESKEESIRQQTGWLGALWELDGNNEELAVERCRREEATKALHEAREELSDVKEELKRSNEKLNNKTRIFMKSFTERGSLLEDTQRELFYTKEKLNECNRNLGNVVTAYRKQELAIAGVTARHENLRQAYHQAHKDLSETRAELKRSDKQLGEDRQQRLVLERDFNTLRGFVERYRLLFAQLRHQQQLSITAPNSPRQRQRRSRRNAFPTTSFSCHPGRRTLTVVARRSGTVTGNYTSPRSITSSSSGASVATNAPRPRWRL